MGRTARIISAEEKQQLIKLCKVGLSFNEILNQVSYSVAQLRKYLAQIQNEGLIECKSVKTRPAYKKQLVIDMLCKDYKDGIKDVDILAKKYNKSIYTVMVYLNLGGISYKDRDRIKKEREQGDTTKQINNDLIAGVPTSEICKKYNVTRQYVSYIKKGIDSKLLPEEKEKKQQKIIELTKQGMSTTDIAKKIDTTPAYVSCVKSSIGATRQITKTQKAIELLKTGMRSAQVARETGLYIERISEIKRKMK